MNTSTKKHFQQHGKLNNKPTAPLSIQGHERAVYKQQSVSTTAKCSTSRILDKHQKLVIL